MLDKVFLGLPDDPEERKDYLESNADAVEELSYTRSLTQEELDAIKESICEATAEIANLEEQKKEAMAEYNKDIAAYKEIRKDKLEKWQHKAEYIKGTCYKVLDHESKQAGYYDDDGNLVFQRPMQKQEMQKTIFSINRQTGTED